MAESDHCMETPGEEFGLYNEEAVSLFSSSLNKALERQSNVIVSTITGLTEKLTKSNAGKNVPHVEEPTVSVNGSPGFEFKHEGHKIQFNFNQARYSKLSELRKLIQECDFQKAADIVKEEQAAILQRNKILKIADRHGWDTVSEYLDDPLSEMINKVHNNILSEIQEMKKDSRFASAASHIHYILRKGKSDNSNRKYDTYFQKFKGWCLAHDVSYLPAAVSTVAVFLSGLVQQSVSESVLSTYFYSIKWYHDCNMCSNPCDQKILHMLMEGGNSWSMEIGFFKGQLH